MHGGCWALVRGNFFEAKEVSRANGSAEVALASINELFSWRANQRLKSQTTPQVPPSALPAMPLLSLILGFSDCPNQPPGKSSPGTVEHSIKS